MDVLVRDNGSDDGALLSQVESTIAEVREDLKSMQAEDGHWVFDLEADATIPAEFILLNHYLNDAPISQPGLHQDHEEAQQNQQSILSADEIATGDHARNMNSSNHVITFLSIMRAATPKAQPIEMKIIKATLNL